MDTTCIIIMSSIFGACLFGSLCACVCSSNTNNSNNRVRPIAGCIIITTEHYENLKKYNLKLIFISMIIQ